MRGTCKMIKNIANKSAVKIVGPGGIGPKWTWGNGTNPHKVKPGPNPIRCSGGSCRKSISENRNTVRKSTPAQRDTRTGESDRTWTPKQFREDTTPRSAPSEKPTIIGMKKDPYTFDAMTKQNLTVDVTKQAPIKKDIKKLIW